MFWFAQFLRPSSAPDPAAGCVPADGPMEFNASYFHAFGNPDFAAVFSDGSAQALRPNPPPATARELA
ncbi:hypothetical protein ZWY2020_041888 [Hordeum vulgare]|nr:hypothetical protein ZWY2020_041888 [Hordeum vulgare]